MASPPACWPGIGRYGERSQRNRSHQTTTAAPQRPPSSETARNESKRAKVGSRRLVASANSARRPGAGLGPSAGADPGRVAQRGNAGRRQGTRLLAPGCRPALLDGRTARDRRRHPAAGHAVGTPTGTSRQATISSAAADRGRRRAHSCPRSPARRHSIDVDAPNCYRPVSPTEVLLAAYVIRYMRDNTC